MAFLLDSNTFIQGKNEAYGFDICPGYWTFIEREHARGELFSIKAVGDELRKGNDELARWARTRGSGFFLPMDTVASGTMSGINVWVQAFGFTDAAVAEYFRGADQFLVAYALAHDHTIVTHEVFEPQRRSRVKIPVVSTQFAVPWLRTYDWLRQQGAAFILQ